MDGIVLIDKPLGWTSFDVVAKVRGILGQSGIVKPKVGHTGTLDPLATGLLIVVVGSYTKRAAEFSKLDKIYEVTMRLGQTSTTGDEEGEKTHVSDKKPSKEEILLAFKQFTGEIMQTPPAYSAVKVNGQRAYKLARAGNKVKLEPRKVTIYNLQLGHKLDKIDAQGRTLDRGEYKYPEVKFTAAVSSGTYIRSLVEDLGKNLDTGAHMSALRRTQVGNFGLEQALSTKTLNTEQIYRYIRLA